MSNLTDIGYVKNLQNNLRIIFDNPQGKEVMEFLENHCGWYRSIFDIQDRDISLINDGKRQVVATLKTLMRLTPEQITVMAQQQEA